MTKKKEEKQDQDTVVETGANVPDGAIAPIPAPPEPPKPPVQKPEKPKKYRYVGKTIKHFEHNEANYQVNPNAVMTNLPLDAPQIKRMIENKELIEV